MKARNRIVLSVVAPLCLLSMSSVADSTAAMDACVKAFVNTSLSKDRAVAVQTVGVRSASLTQRPPYLIALTATGKQSGRRLAQATCRVSRSGAITALNGKPLAGPTDGATKVALGER